MWKRLMIHRNNKGSTILIVIICMSLVSILATVVLSTAFTNYQMKRVDRNAKSNFYTAEMAVDELKAGFEEEFANLIESTYLSVLVKYSDYSVGEKNTAFKIEFLQRFINKFGKEAYPLTLVAGKYTGTGQYKFDDISTYIVDKADGGVAEVIPSTATNVLEWSLDTTNTKEQYVAMRNIEVSYLDENAYKTYIKTDFKFNIPNIEFEAIGDIPPFAEYAIIADNQVLVQNSSAYVKGNVYAGASGIVADGSSAFELFSNVIITRGEIKTDNNGKISINNGVASDAWGEIWAQNISTQATSIGNGEMNLTGDFYISDDVTLNSAGSTVTLTGNYYGYGYGYADGSEVGTGIDNHDHHKSSSIIINRKNCTLNMENITNLFIAGRAFITADSETGDLDASSNVMIGEAIATKADQVIYWLPGNAIGVAADGTSRGANPITREQYDLIHNSTEYQEVDPNYPLFDDKTISSYTNPNDCYQTIFDIVDGQEWVYYYLKFKDEYAANQYVKDCIQNETYFNKLMRSLEEYNSIIIKPSIFIDAAHGRKTFAGNIVLFNRVAGTMEAQAEVIYNSVNAELPQQFISESDNLKVEYTALSQKLVRSLTQYEGKTYDVDSTFHALILGARESEKDDTGALTGFLKLCGPLGYEESDPATGGKVILVDNDDPGDVAFEIKDTSVVGNETCIIIATGDVVVSKNVNGLIMSGGTVTLKDNCTVTADPTTVFELVCNTKVKEVFRDLSEFSRYTDADRYDTVPIEDLIDVENWRRY